LALVAGQRHVVTSGDALGAVRTRHVLAEPVATAEPTAGERAPGDHAHPVALTRREHVVLDPAHEHRIGRLLAHEPLAAALPGHPLRLDDLARGERRGA